MLCEGLLTEIHVSFRVKDQETQDHEIFRSIIGIDGKEDKLTCS